MQLYVYIYVWPPAVGGSPTPHGHGVKIILFTIPPAAPPWCGAATQQLISTMKQFNDRSPPPPLWNGCCCKMSVSTEIVNENCLICLAKSIICNDLNHATLLMKAWTAGGIRRLGHFDGSSDAPRFCKSERLLMAEAVLLLMAEAAADVDHAMGRDPAPTGGGWPDKYTFP